MERKRLPHLSELFTEDCPDFACLFHIASTTRRPAKGDERYRNTKKYPIDDYSTESDEVDQYYRTLGDCRILSQFTGTVKVCDPPVNYPQQRLLQHWADKFHDGVPIIITKTEFGDKRPHITILPLEKLPKECHAINPDVHYELHSKRFIGTIDCPQAKVLDTPVYPCVLKLCISSAAHGVWIINNENEYNERLQNIQDNMPNADYILTEFVDNIAKNYTIHLYLNKAGDYTWLGGAEQRFDNAGIFAGGVYCHENQQEIRGLVLNALIPVVEAAHRKDYFGYLSVDVLVDANGDSFVVDINPRWGACSVAILGTVNTMAKKGYGTSIFLKGFNFNGPLDDILDRLSAIQAGEVVVVAAGCCLDMMRCELVIYAPTYDDCCRIEKECRALEDNNNVA